MTELTKSIKKVVLINKQVLEKRNSAPVCQNCGKIGHRTDRCYSKAEEKNKNSTTDKPGKSMLALKEPAIVGISDSKRMRVDYLTDNYYFKPAQKDTTEDIPKTFSIVSVARENYYVFVNTGAMHSLIEYKVLKQLSIEPTKLLKPHYIQPVGGPKIALSHKARLKIKIEEDFFIGDDFFAIYDCAVPIL
ncbi:hypothetical protein BB561_004409 [Smittium simulii]|uniref:CCHC-type domain-containing protein n=1 Tax=Smittium simulii TaxID=133385 RepID=A0A2T9YGC6_9FUNG|nr:hypothetical protein BB561_004409 [Smittium simulii]